GSKGPLRVTLNAMVGVSHPTEHMKMMNVEQYWQVRNEAEFYEKGTPEFSREALAGKMSLPYVDWYDEVFKKAAFQQQYNITLEGGNDRISTYTNIGYITDNGLLRSGDIGYNKYSMRNGTKLKINKYLRADLILSGYADTRKQPGTWDDTFMYLNKATHGIIPSETVFANNNSAYYNRPAPLDDNPAYFAQRDLFGYGEWRDKFFQGSLALTFDIPGVKGLFLKAQVAYDTKSTVRTRVQKRAVLYDYSTDADQYTQVINGAYTPSIEEQNWLTDRLNFQGSINYKNTFADAHNVAATVVFEPRRETSRYLRAKRFYTDDLFTSDNIDRAPQANWENSGNTGELTSVSIVGRFNYDYRGKYMVEFAFREDGSYRYDPSRRWGFFPVVSGAWRISEESFIKDNIPFLSNLKIRASWGRSGEDAGDPFQYVPGYSGYEGYVFDNSYVNGYAGMGLLNKNLWWVKTEMINAGLDLSLWNGALDFSVDLYRRDRDGLLETRKQAITNTFGAKLPKENLNSERTEGFELMVGHRYSIGDFSWGVSANMNFSRRYTMYKETSPYRSSMARWRDGSSVGRYHDIGWGYKVLGQYQNYDQIRNGVIETGGAANTKTLPGDYIHWDANGNGIIDGGDTTPLFWNGDPKMTYGVTMYASWKSLDFSMLWSGAAKYTVSYGGILGEAMTQDRTNSPATYFDRWHRTDVYDPNSTWVSGKYPAIRRLSDDDGANRLESDVKRINASYARLKNVELGYVLPKKLLKGSGISKLRVYINLTNPLLICNDLLKGFDPEASDQQNGFKYPLSKSYNFGVNVTF
ncbi:MAG: SusC/RagA family TonB-linked outer membrane protein, partial [Alistipes sp.]